MNVSTPHVRVACQFSISVLQHKEKSLSANGIGIKFPGRWQSYFCLQGNTAEHNTSEVTVIAYFDRFLPSILNGSGLSCKGRPNLTVISFPFLI